MNYQKLLEEIQNEVRPLIGNGKVADYIPRLASVPPNKFGMAVQTVDGALFQVGDANEPFSIQSISKAYTLTLALQFVGESLWRRVGLEPSGNPFNSLVQLEHEHGIPRNPFINAGAIVVADAILSHTGDSRDTLLDFVRLAAHNTAIQDDAEVARSEKDWGYRNAALANFLKSFGNLTNAVEDVLDLYFFHCSFVMSCVDLAKGFLFLANGGRSPWTNEQITTRRQAKRINALMLTCGTYDAVGEFAYRVGIPCKSGVGGGIVGIIPNHLCVAVWSPGLDESGNSLAGTYALDLFTTKTEVSIF